MDVLVTPEWLAVNKKSLNVVVVHVLFNGPASKTTTNASLQIPGSRALDLKNEFSDTSSPFPGTFPTKIDFNAQVRALGISNNSTVVVYDIDGVYASPRVWWMFKTMGHENIMILQGGLPAWQHAGYATEALQKYNFPQGNFKALKAQPAVKTYDFVKENYSNPNIQLIDARSAGRFLGTAPEPRAELQSGHIPNSINIPYTSVLVNGGFAPITELTELFAAYPLKNKILVFSCGSGVTAAVVLCAAAMVLPNEMYIYDGSWTEWATKEKLFSDS